MSQQKTNAQKVFSETKIFTNFKNQKQMKNLKNLNLVELNAQEVRETEGGWLQYLPVAVAVGAAFVWAWDKGEELGKALAKNH